MQWIHSPQHTHSLRSFAVFRTWAILGQFLLCGLKFSKKTWAQLRTYNRHNLIRLGIGWFFSARKISLKTRVLDFETSESARVWRLHMILREPTGRTRTQSKKFIFFSKSSNYTHLLGNWSQKRQLLANRSCFPAALRWSNNGKGQFIPESQHLFGSHKLYFWERHRMHNIEYMNINFSHFLHFLYTLHWNVTKLYTFHTCWVDLNE